MKKIITFFILIFILPTTLLAKENVSFSKCVDGDTAKFILNNEEITVRFLAIDTPEVKHPKKKAQPYGKKASEYTCNKLNNAKKIQIEFDNNSDKTDKYDRYLAWIFVDNNLLQKELVSKGLAKVQYLYGDYKYTNILLKEEKIAKDKKINIWNDNNDIEDFIKKMPTTIKLIITLSIIIIIIIYLHFDNKTRTRLLRKGKAKLKKELINTIKKENK